MSANSTYDAAVIGGGMYGSFIAAQLKRIRGGRVILFEKEPSLASRATYNNQARVHNGYHYPRSFMTAYRSHINYERFIKEYRDCIDGHYESYYAVAKIGSKVTANQFKTFIQRIGAPMEPAPLSVKALFDRHLVEEVFRTEESVFDAVKLGHRITEELKHAEVDVRLGAKVTRLERNGNAIRLHYEPGGSPEWIDAKRVFNAAYSQINQILRDSNLPLIPLKHELAEIALIEMPDELRNAGVTVMCGAFFSALPFPPAGNLHTLSHVRYTPHSFWYDIDGEYADAYERLAAAGKTSHFPQMIKDAERFLPLIGRSRYKDSLWEIKTVLPLNEIDDGRPILFKKDHSIPGLACVMGSKIDNIYDVYDELENLD